MIRAPRSDGVANREKVLAAALRTLQRDMTAPMAVVAQEAGVDVGTLYRHFRDREARAALRCEELHQEGQAA
ncbi:TetR family transcriptional regulator [Micromonospora sp. NPDC047527]|uniref:TetR family transcriptional regulator n=1 Tax=Micromonospora sp. NPDC047527 TaxID=3155144 RepID=UPI0034092397